MGMRFIGDWPAFRSLMNAKDFQNRWMVNKRQFLQTTGIGVTGLMTKIILRESPFAENAPLTAILKGSSLPLVDDNDFVQSITHQTKGDEVFVGVLRSSGNFNVAAIIHEGATVKVTKKMRGFFYNLANTIAGVKPLNPKTKKIRIPSRPYAKETFEHPSLSPYVKEQGEALIFNSVNPRGKKPFRSAV
jgi:hypothetical protein